MERLGDIVARVLANVRATMEEERAGEHEALRQAARAGGGDKVLALARGDAHPRSSSRRMAKKATGLDAKISMKR
jgi:hypothetical protein